MQSKDKLILTLAVVLISLGITGYYQLDDKAIQILSLSLGLIFAFVAVYLSPIGRRFVVYAQNSVAEAKKIVWPKIQDSNKMTLLVFVFVFTLAVFLWLLDSLLSYLLYDILLS